MAHDKDTEHDSLRVCFPVERQQRVRRMQPPRIAEQNYTEHHYLL
jgi:hypothetical protein